MWTADSWHFHVTLLQLEKHVRCLRGNKGSENKLRCPLENKDSALFPAPLLFPPEIKCGATEAFFPSEML